MIRPGSKSKKVSRIPVTPWPITARTNPHTVFEDECTILVQTHTNNAKLQAVSICTVLAGILEGN